MNKCIHYTKGYKYQLSVEYKTKTDITGHAIDTPFIKLEPNGMLTLRIGYAWDGPSGPTFDDETNIRASAEHDAFYKLMRMNLLPFSEFKKVNDRLWETCIEDDMLEFRANYWLIGVNKFAIANAQPKNKKKVYIAPKRCNT